MPTTRSIEEVLAAKPTIEGAGVHLRRAFGNLEVPRLDPFLLLDDMSSENPVDYAAGFPWHPHRGIETVTYVLAGNVAHEDSLGNKGTIGPGDVQWMTAGSGIIHQEMPKVQPGGMGGFQLWVNLPQSHKMMQPRYQEVQSSKVPLVEPTKGARVHVVAGEVAGTQGPVRDIVVAPTYLDLELKPHASFTQPIEPGHRAFAYLINGGARFDRDSADRIDDGHLVILGDGDDARITAGRDGARMLLVAGKPLREPVAWWGPIVMNNNRELEEAVSEFQAGTFIKHRASGALA